MGQRYARHGDVWVQALEPRSLAVRIAERRDDADGEKNNPQQERDEFQFFDSQEALPKNRQGKTVTIAGWIKRQTSYYSWVQGAIT